MTPTARTTVAAVIGDPVRHSLSPAIHNAAFDQLGLDWVYTAFAVPTGGGASAVQAMRALGLGGLSVTMPLKAEVASAADRRTDTAERLGVGNTLFWADDQIVVDATDGDGFVASVCNETSWTPKGAKAVVLGAGGAARAIIEALGRAGAAVAVVNRTAEAAQTAARLHADAFVGAVEDVTDASLVVNSTSIGMAGGPAPQETPLDPRWLRPNLVVADIVYHPRQTPLLAAASERGATTVGGVGMLVEQAGLQFTRWTGIEAPIDAMRSAIDRATSADT